MTVYHLFKNQAFEPEAIATMTSAYTDVCRTLGLRDHDHPQTNAIAEKVDPSAPICDRGAGALADAGSPNS